MWMDRRGHGGNRLGQEIIETDRPLFGGFEIISSSGLNIFIRGAWIELDNITVNIPSEKLSLPASEAEVFVFMNPNTKRIEQNTTGWPDAVPRLYKFSTGADAISSQEDCRPSCRFSQHSNFKTFDDYLVSEDTDIDIDWGLIDLEAVPDLVVPKNATVLKAYIGINDSGSPEAGVYASFRKPGDIEITREIRLYPQVSRVWFSVAAPIGLDANHRFERKIRVSENFQLRMTLLGWEYGR